MALTVGREGTLIKWYALLEKGIKSNAKVCTKPHEAGILKHHIAWVVSSQNMQVLSLL